MRSVRTPCFTTAADATTNGNAIDVSQLAVGSVHVISGGSSPVGTAKIQFSNDNGTTWTDVGSASVSVNATGGFAIAPITISYQKIRVVWTKTSGTCSIQAYFLGRDNS